MIRGTICFPYAEKEYECWCENDNTLIFAFDYFLVEYNKNEGRFEMFEDTFRGKVCLYSDYQDRRICQRYAFSELEINLIKMEIQNIIANGIFLQEEEELELA